MLRKTVTLVVLALLLASCASGIPQVTPTFAPTRTDTPTPEPTAIAQEAASRTPIPTLTDTATATWTPSSTVTNTPSSTPTETLTPSDTPTGTQTPSSTPTDTPTATVTPSPTATHTATNTPIPTETDTPIPTNTPSITPLPLPDTPTNTPIPTATNTPTVTNTPVPSATTTPTPTNTPTTPPLPTLTSSPQVQPTSTLSPDQLTQIWANVTATTAARITPSVEPTRDITPTLVTPNPETGIVSTPVVIVSSPVPDVPPSTAFPTPTNAPTVDPVIVPVRPTIAFPPPAPPSFTTFSGGALVFTTNGGIAGVSGVPVPGGDVSFISYNPVFADSYVRVDTRGMVYMVPPGSTTEGTYTFAPFFDGFDVASASENKNRVIEARWSPNGQQFAFIIFSPPGTDHINDGLWFWQADQSGATDPSYQIIRDCIACGIVNPTNTFNWRSRSLQWANDNVAILVEFDLPDEGRGGVGVVYAVRDANAGATGPTVHRYDYGAWANDQSRIVVSGRRPDGVVIIGTIGRDGGGEQVVFNASGAGMWVQDAVQLPDGRFVALGREGDANGPMRIVDQNGSALTGDIGTGPPSQVEWSCDRSAVSVVANGQRYIATISGDVREVPNVAANFTCTRAPAIAQPVSNAPAPENLPSGVVANSRYQPGQQLQIYSTVINIRTFPSTDSGFAGNALSLGEYVRIVAGPYPDPNGRYIWWEVTTASGVTGWIAGSIDGRDTIGP